MPNIEVTAEVATEIHRLHGRISELERQVQEAHAELGLASQTDVQARLHARVAELENYRINSAKFVSDVITENDFYREQLRRIASETHTRLYMQDIAREALNR